MPDSVNCLLQRVSWQAEKLFKARGWLRTMVWCTETEDGRRQMFETACEVERAEITDAQALAVLFAELRADFAADGVVSYAVAFPASATTVLSSSILHLDHEWAELARLIRSPRRRGRATWPNGETKHPRASERTRAAKTLLVFLDGLDKMS